MYHKFMQNYNQESEKLEQANKSLEEIKEKLQKSEEAYTMLVKELE